jgi:uncharacterized protein YbjQ (UPF0145 family)
MNSELPVPTGGITLTQSGGVMLVTNHEIPGYRLVKTIGLVRGNTVRTRHAGHDIMAAFKNLVGGEVENYTKMIAESREQALDRMAQQAGDQGGNAVIGVRFSTSSIMAGAAELLAYGTAVVIEKI